MHSYEALAAQFAERFGADHFPAEPASLYNPNRYFLGMGGKRIRPVLCLMGNELFEAVHPDAWRAGMAVELFHNFTLIHDDIMDKAPLRRGIATVHQKFGESTALLAGDVMLVKAYDYLNQIEPKYARTLFAIFNQTAREVCEGQQLDMDYERADSVAFDDYLRMINLKTSVLLAASLAMGAVLGGASERNRQLIYEFGRKLGLAFQVQDDYLDAFGDPQKFGKQVGGDIMANKKTFLLIHALESAAGEDKENLETVLRSTAADKVHQVLRIYKESRVDVWAQELKEKFLQEALSHLDDIAVVSKRKEPLRDLALYLVQRDR